MPEEELDGTDMRRLTFSLACLAILCSIGAYFAGGGFSASPSGVALSLGLVSWAAGPIALVPVAFLLLRERSWRSRGRGGVLLALLGLCLTIPLMVPLFDVQFAAYLPVPLSSGLLLADYFRSAASTVGASGFSVICAFLAYAYVDEARSVNQQAARASARRSASTLSS